MSEPQNKLAYAYAVLTEHVAEQVARQFADQFADHLHRMISTGDVCGTFEVHPRQFRDLANQYPSLAMLKLEGGGWHLAEAAAWADADVPRLRELLLRRWEPAKVEAFIDLYNSERPRPRPRPGRRRKAAS